MIEQNNRNHSGLFEEPLTNGELELLKYKFKKYQSGVPKHLTDKKVRDIPYFTPLCRHI